MVKRQDVPDLNMIDSSTALERYAVGTFASLIKQDLWSDHVSSTLSSILSMLVATDPEQWVMPASRRLEQDRRASASTYESGDWSYSRTRRASEMNGDEDETASFHAKPACSDASLNRHRPASSAALRTLSTSVRLTARLIS